MPLHELFNPRASDLHPNPKPDSTTLTHPVAHHWWCLGCQSGDPCTSAALRHLQSRSTHLGPPAAAPSGQQGAASAAEPAKAREHKRTDYEHTGNEHAGMLLLQSLRMQGAHWQQAQKQPAHWQRAYC